MFNHYQENKDNMKFICNHKLVNDESIIRLLNPTSRQSNHKTCNWIVTYTWIVNSIDTLWKFQTFVESMSLDSFFFLGALTTLSMDLKMSFET